ncbi:uncharacterized protein LOC135084223 [Ostrinia nubilalis]|uniref:uncharacterized protein LOC135084223 n=1 Tax=Ostrinia nubilalis TaxID=29057 RepID=UPI00308268D2
MEQQIMVKTEMQAQPNGEILLFYVDENETENSSVELVQMQEKSNSVEYEVQLDEAPLTTVWAEPVKLRWTEEEVQKLLVFYVDNKETFITGTAKKKHLWAIACKTMLVGKTADNCDVKLRNLKHKYSSMLIDQQKGVAVTWPLFNLCHQAFHDDTYVQFILRAQLSQPQKKIKVPVENNPIEESSNSGVITVKNINTNKSTGDAKVEAMLNLYLKYKKNFQKDYWRRGLWETIAIELGEEDSDYWHKRFLNFRQHYLRAHAKRESQGPDSVQWPYMHLFDQIFEDDPEFQRKFLENGTRKAEVQPVDVNEWNETEKTILVKYYFDCFDEFMDKTIPNNFLWNEVSRLLDKKPEVCKSKYQELKDEHLNLYFEGGYSLRQRKPLAILFDNIISKETVLELANNTTYVVVWKTEDIDLLVEFLYENMIVFKDPVCYNVFWACLSKKLKRSVQTCKQKWEELKTLYKSILEDKKENPDMQIDWRYIEMFDVIFDYGMDTNLLNDFKYLKKDQDTSKTDNKLAVARVNIKTDELPDISDDEEFDERGFTKRVRRGVGDSKAFQILEYYQKNKEKFSTSQRKKQALWDQLAGQLGMSGEKCAHRFRNLKQVYISYVQREINKPEMPILWPYYALCKKVFGYRAIKNKLKNNKIGSAETEEWATKEIKQIINYYSSNFSDLSESCDSTKWAPLARIMNKSETAVNIKFMELQKSYKRLKAMKETHPECKVSWKYYNMFEDVFAKTGNDLEIVEYVDDEIMEVDELVYEDDVVEEIIDSQDEDDYQCIIVLPEGQELSDISNAKIIIQQTSEDGTNDEQPQAKPGVTKWNKRSKKKLLVLYLNYIRSRKGKEINPKEMWTEIASKLSEKTPLSCRKMLARLKANHTKQTDDEEANRRKSLYHNLMEKVLLLKPKFAKKTQTSSKDGKTYKDVQLPTQKVELALQYYLQHIEEFSNPRFEKKYLWTELANFVSEPVNKLFNKINYLKQFFNVETEEVAGEKTLFSELLQEILNKENMLKTQTDTEAKISLEDGEEVIWTDEETEQLLVWYLANLDKFKNPKFVRKYLWMEASSILGKSPLACSKMMTKIRTEYKTMIKENPEELNSWRFYGLCQKIYGTGKKVESNPTCLVQLMEAAASEEKIE